MQLIFLVASLALLWLHLAGLTAVVGRWLPFPIARATGVLLVTLAVCAVEHFAGLGNLSWAWPFTAALAGLALYICRKELKGSDFWRWEKVLLVGFAIGFVWKYCFPGIYPNAGERTADLYFMLNYMPGEQLPPLDTWYPPYKFDFYYAFMHYGAALMARLFGWEPVFAYNIAFGLVMGLSLTLAWYFAGRFIEKVWARWLLVAAITLGGTGITPIIHFAVGQPADKPDSWAATEYMWGSARFIGNFDQWVNTDFGRALFPKTPPEAKPTPDWEPRDIPMENFGYQFFLGDFHPPIGGYLLLFLALALIAWVEAPPREDEADHRRIGQFLLPITAAAMLITNTWIFPFAALLVLTWAGWRQWQKNPPDWQAVFAGAIVGGLLVYPYLSGLAAQAISTPIKPVPMGDHTPPLRFLIFWWPMLVMMGLAVVDKKTRPLAICFGVAFLVMLAISELVYVDDPSGGKYDRTNTTMKWWGWLYSGGLLACGALALASTLRWVRVATVIALLLVCSYAYDVARYWIHTPKTEMGQLNGKSWFIRDQPALRDMINYLKHAERGIVLENWLGDAYTNQGLVAMFAQQVSMMGWVNHVSLWHGAPSSVWSETNLLKSFYKGEMPDMANWLARHKVDYIVWTPADNNASPQSWATINNAIAGHYSWKPFGDNPLTGLWVRREIKP
ncbi:DUF2298 domain-containing protein [Chitinolyticbacter meiyuanensis]|uniref:DUF2298 domain-containing protein n=1 Tax=Chitinolyticbacter meiyuanensis TaxID=682798 RepID=UPI0011E5C2FE|nr:DUF2298 domain-containing protein [Chitinolyticbacter meiyuanensis]